jgi:hypothetical protein
MWKQNPTLVAVLPMARSQPASLLSRQRIFHISMIWTVDGTGGFTLLVDQAPSGNLTSIDHWPGKPSSGSTHSAETPTLKHLGQRVVRFASGEMIRYSNESGRPQLLDFHLGLTNHSRIGPRGWTGRE